MTPKLLDWIALMLLQTSQDQLQVFLTAVGGMVQYAREDEAIQLQTVNARLSQQHEPLNHVTPLLRVECLLHFSSLSSYRPPTIAAAALWHVSG